MDWRVRSARERVVWRELVADVEGGRGKLSGLIVGDGESSGVRALSLDLKAIERRVRSAREGWRLGRAGLANSVLSAMGSCLGGSRLIGEAEDVGSSKLCDFASTGVLVESSLPASRMPSPDNAASIPPIDSSASSCGGGRTGVA